jgi:hypothetical protein
VIASSQDSKDIILEALSVVKQAARAGKIRKSRGAPFVAIVHRAAVRRVSADHVLSGVTAGNIGFHRNNSP